MSEVPLSLLLLHGAVHVVVNEAGDALGVLGGLQLVQ